MINWSYNKNIKFEGLREMIRDCIKEARLLDIEYTGNLPVIDAFRNHLSWRGLLDKCYISQTFKMLKSGITIKGIDALSSSYSNKNIIITAPAGYGKTTALKYLYFNDERTKVTSYYTSVSIFFEDVNTLDEYELLLRNAVENKTSINGVILLDGLEEVFHNNYDAVDSFLGKVGRCNNVVWISCRPDFYENINSRYDRFFFDIAEIQPWRDKEFNSFLTSYEEKLNWKGLKDKIERLKSNSAIDHTAYLCPLYATMLVFIATDEQYEKNIRDEYDLIKIFLSLWIKREILIQGSMNSVDDYFSFFRLIAIHLYKRLTLRVDDYSSSIDFNDGVIKSLLKEDRNSQVIHSFFHREFLVFFVVNGMLSVALEGTRDIVFWYSQTFYKDVTTLWKKAIFHYSKDEKEKIYLHLFHIYKESYENHEEIKHLLQTYKMKADDIGFLKLRDELLYFIFKIPFLSSKDFFDYAYQHSLDTKDYMIMLGLAYGMAGICQHKHTLNFAKKLRKGEPEALVNRSWAVCFFGDVSEDGYCYVDNKNCSWERVRKAKIERIGRKEEKYYRYRLLDIPLLYCFYESRNFQDCTSYKEYQAIIQSDISYEYYSEEEKKFITKKKKMLVNTYRTNLVRNAIQHTGSISYYQVKAKTNNGEKTVIEITKELENQLLEQEKISEEISNNLKRFWKNYGNHIISKYECKLTVPAGNPLRKIELHEKLCQCKILLLTANYIEGTIITQCLMECSGCRVLDRITEDKHIYQFATINDIPVVHIWPQETSSFTVHGSFLALKAALSRFTPKYVFSVGVAFGSDTNSQKLGDVLVSERLVFYDSFNKITNGKLILSPDEVQLVGEEILAGCQFLKNSRPPVQVNISPSRWHLGTMLTGGSVLSDPFEKNRLIQASKNMGYDIIGGEMEGSGVYFACNSGTSKIPFLIVKGICDWAVNKNGWTFVSLKKEERDKIKDCVQAYATENAFKTFYYIISQISL